MTVEYATLAGRIADLRLDLLHLVDHWRTAEFPELLAALEALAVIRLDLDALERDAKLLAIERIEAAGGHIDHAGIRHTVDHKPRWVIDHDRVAALVASRAAADAATGETTPDLRAGAETAARMMAALYVTPWAKPDAAQLMRELRVRLPDVADQVDERGDAVIKFQPIPTSKERATDGHPQEAQQRHPDQEAREEGGRRPAARPGTRAD